MSEPLREYRVVLHGIPTTALLSSADALRLGAVPIDAEAATVVETTVVTTKVATPPPNKARTADTAGPGRILRKE